MTAKEAVVRRFVEYCIKNDLAFNGLANVSGVAPTSVYSMMDPKRRDVGISSIKKLCDGLEISLREFFDSPLFDELEQEIK